MNPRKISEEGDEFFNKGDFIEAEKRYRQLLDAGCMFPDVFNKMGLIAFERRHLEKAVEYFNKALEINPKYTEVSLNLIVAYNELGQYDKAKEISMEAKGVREKESGKMDPFVKGKLANRHFETGEIYYELGMLDEALAEYKKAAALRPDFVDVKVQMGLVYRDKGQTEQAIREFQEAKVANPYYGAAGINLGVTYYSMSKFKLAEQEWQEVLRKNPNNKSAKMYLDLMKKQS